MQDIPLYFTFIRIPGRNYSLLVLFEIFFNIFNQRLYRAIYRFRALTFIQRQKAERKTESNQCQKIFAVQLRTPIQLHIVSQAFIDHRCRFPVPFLFSAFDPNRIGATGDLQVNCKFIVHRIYSFKREMHLSISRTNLLNLAFEAFTSSSSPLRALAIFNL